MERLRQPIGIQRLRLLVRHALSVEQVRNSSIARRCGRGHRGELVVDATDQCCQMHDACWGVVQSNFPGCNPFWRLYDYGQHSGGSVQCTDPVNTCDYHSCLCDRIAVDCFLRQRNTTYDADFDDWHGLCTTTTRAADDDPDRCAPVWNRHQRYPQGSLVSLNGINYWSLHASSPGENPKNNLQTWFMPGLQGTWKKLQPCRRTAF